MAADTLPLLFALGGIIGFCLWQARRVLDRQILNRLERLERAEGSTDAQLHLTQMQFNSLRQEVNSLNDELLTYRRERAEPRAEPAENVSRNAPSFSPLEMSIEKSAKSEKYVKTRFERV